MVSFFYEQLQLIVWKSYSLGQRPALTYNETLKYCAYYNYTVSNSIIYS